MAASDNAHNSAEARACLKVLREVRDVVRAMRGDPELLRKLEAMEDGYNWIVQRSEHRGCL